MERNLFKDLKRWKNKKNRKPLIIQGARQVGKTWIMKEFGNRYYKNMVYINFDNNEVMKKVFEIDFILQQDLECIPVEVKAGENLRAKSLRAFCAKYKPQSAIRTSMSDYRKEEWMTNVPLYMLMDYLESEYE